MDNGTARLDISIRRKVAVFFPADFQMSDDEAPVIKTKKKCSEKQLESLRKGMEKMKQKREAIAKEREEHEKKDDVTEKDLLSKAKHKCETECHDQINFRNHSS